MYTKSEQELQECISHQKQFCKEHNHPHFAPENGICFRCRRNIYQNYLFGNRTSYGWSRDNQLVTGCKHCNISYCE